MLKQILKRVLKYMARLVLAKYKPKIVAVTGSVGKTSTKEAILYVLKDDFETAGSFGNYNNELGLPLAILGSQTGGRNIFSWVMVVINFFGLMFGNRYPKILVLEMGADHPGDISYLLSIAKPDFAVVTKVAEAHTEFFKSIEGVQKEKSKIVSALSEYGTAILNIDDPRVASMKNLNKGKTIFFGFHPDSDIRARNAELNQVTYGPDFRAETDFSTRGQITFGGRNIFFESQGNLGHPKVYSILAALAVASLFGINLESAVKKLRKLPTLPGRLSPLSGIKRTIILDDSYNSSPDAAIESLRILKQIRAKRRVAILGDMLELGPVTERAHRRVGNLVKSLGLDILFTVGPRAKFIADEARNAGFPKTKIFEYETAEKTAMSVQKKIEQGDAILIKGSRGMHLEKVVLEIMAEPEKAEFLLCH